MSGKWFVYLAVLLVAITATAGAVNVNISVTDPAGNPAKGTYKIFDQAGETVKSGDINGSVTVSLSAGDYYLFVITKNETVVSPITITDTTTDISVDATTMKFAKALAEFPKTYIGTPTALVSFKISDTNITYDFATNWTIYASNLQSTMTYPNETRTGVYKFQLEKIVVDGTETNETTISLDFSNDVTIKAIYKSAYVIEPMYLMLLIGVVALGLIAIVIVSGKKAKSAIMENEVSSMRFYKRRL